MRAEHPEERAFTLLESPGAPSGNCTRVLGIRLGRPSLFWILQCAGWAAFGVVMFAWGLSYWDPVDALVNKALLVAGGYVLTLGFRPLYRTARRRSIPLMASAFVVVAASFAGAAVWIAAEALSFELYYGARNGRGLVLDLPVIPFGTLLYYGFVLLAWSLLYYGINHLIELERERERAARAEAMAHEARLRALQFQLEPHFLFNTLNAISTLVVEGRNSEAARMIARLSDFLRLTLEAAGTPEISVAEELEFVRSYLEIEQVRFGERLQVRLDVSPEAMRALIPALLLQPLVENAVKHGVLPRELGGRVEVTVARHNGSLRIGVVDDGAGLAGNPHPGFGVGLQNTAARLDELYGEQSRFSLAASAGGGVAATIELPFRTAPSQPRHDDSDGGRE